MAVDIGQVFDERCLSTRSDNSLRCLLINGIDEVLQFLGQGTFGKVVRAFDSKRKEEVAIKMILPKFRKVAQDELRNLLYIGEKDTQSKLIRVKGSFNYRGAICVVMNLLDLSIHDFLKKNCCYPFPNSHIQFIARQLFEQVSCKC